MCVLGAGLAAWDSGVKSACCSRNLVPSIHVGTSQVPAAPAPGHLTLSFDLCGHLHSHFIYFVFLLFVISFPPIYLLILFFVFLLKKKKSVLWEFCLCCAHTYQSPQLFPDASSIPYPSSIVSKTKPNKTKPKKTSLGWTTLIPLEPEV